MRIFHQALFFAFLGCCSAGAQPDSLAADDMEAKKAQVDSLLHEADILDERASRLEDRLESAGENRSDLGEELKEQIEELRDAVDNIRDNVEQAVDALEDAREEAVEKIEDALDEREEKRHAGSFIVALEYSRLDVRPLESLQKNDKSLTGKYTFDFSNRSMMTFGLMGYYNMENNVRVGNGISAGYKSYQSGTYSTTAYDSLLEISEPVDSVVTLRVIPASIGFVCEKAFMYDPVNFFAGMMIGGNLTIVVKEEQEAQLESSFISSGSDSDHDSRYSVALAPAVAWDVHGGAAFKVSRIMHIGFDAIIRFAYAYEGFGAGFGDFLSVNPGFRLRLTFGNAG
jgi:TolA-binding protein